jgi:hypothetical protein
MERFVLTSVRYDHEANITYIKYIIKDSGAQNTYSMVLHTDVEISEIYNNIYATHKGKN